MIGSFLGFKVLRIRGFEWHEVMNEIAYGSNCELETQVSPTEREKNLCHYAV